LSTSATKGAGALKPGQPRPIKLGVLNVTALGATVDEAQARAYEAIAMGQERT
jgi:hypothetical protein